MKNKLQKILKKRPVVLDGAVGTTFQAMGLKPVCYEELVLTNEEDVKQVHKDYLNAGSDIIFTNTFGANAVSLSEAGLESRTTEINLKAAKIAREAILEAGFKDRFVAGDIGPTSKLPTLKQITFDELFKAYELQFTGLIEGGVDLLMIETCQDPLQFKCAIAAATQAMKGSGREVPYIVSITVERNGLMLLGTEISAAISSVAPYEPLAFGINCATGPQDMKEHLKFLSVNSSFPIVCQPNAGLPTIVDGKPVYDMPPQKFGRIMADYVERFDLSFVGGCCGTTPAHIAELVKGLSKVKRKEHAKKDATPTASSLFTSVTFDQEPKPLLVAEQTNVNGSKKFRNLLKAEDFDAMVEVAKAASKTSHLIDLCLASTGRDEIVDYNKLVGQIAVKVDSPIMIDSTSEGAIEAALKLCPGRAIINSINLEDGGDKAKRIIMLAKKYGAALVGLVIDEDGMAKSFKRKVDIAERIVDLCLFEGLNKDDLFIDFLTFTLASGDHELYDAATETLKAIDHCKCKMDGVRTILGVSNISFGLPVKGRKYLTSIFLKGALKSGLDAAIINPIKVVRPDQIPDDIRDLCEKLVANERKDGDPLLELIDLINRYDGVDRSKTTEKQSGVLSPEEALKRRVIEGNRDGLSRLIDEVLESKIPPSEIINKILLPAMGEVGVDFGEGKLPLPFVLESAETMRKAIDFITPHMKGGVAKKKGKIVLATVRGDVHDIGKNLVDAILSNNGFEVINLGIRQPAAAIIDAVKKSDADAIGLSGLLVSSTQIMREEIAYFRESGIDIPVLCGGAALTSSFVKDVLQPVYEGEVLYCKDAFSGFSAMEKIYKASN